MWFGEVVGEALYQVQKFSSDFISDIDQAVGIEAENLSNGSEQDQSVSPGEQSGKKYVPKNSDKEPIFVESPNSQSFAPEILSETEGKTVTTEYCERAEVLKVETSHETDEIKELEHDLSTVTEMLYKTRAEVIAKDSEIKLLNEEKLKYEDKMKEMSDKICQLVEQLKESNTQITELSADKSQKDVQILSLQNEIINLNQRSETQHVPSDHSVISSDSESYEEV